jgi:hypothetical protein
MVARDGIEPPPAFSGLRSGFPQVEGKIEIRGRKALSSYQRRYEMHQSQTFVHLTSFC